MSYDADRELHAPLLRQEAAYSAYEARIEKAREELLYWLASPHQFEQLLKAEPRYLTTREIQLVVIARDRLEDEGFSGSEEVRLGLIDDCKARDGWLSEFVANERD